jgi:cysteine-rich repeat protein
MRLAFVCSLLAAVGCTTTSDAPFCGDGFLDSGETCDDGNNVAGDGCFQCAIETDGACGDNAVDPGEACDDGNTTSGDGCSADCQTVEVSRVTTVNWSFKDLANNQTTGCPAGFDTAAVVSQPLDASGAPTGNAIIDLFSCADLTGTTAPLPSGVYETHVDITNTGGALTYAQSVSAVVDLTAADKTLTVEILNDGGYFGFAWTLRGATSNNVLTCADVPGQAGVTLEATVTGSTMGTSDVFDCADGSGVTAGLLAGSYTISNSIIDAQGAALGTAPAQGNKLIQAPNKVTDLGSIEIPVDGL